MVLTTVAAAGFGGVTLAQAKDSCPGSGNGWTKVDSNDLSLYPVPGATEYCFKFGSANSQGCTGGVSSSWPPPGVANPCGLSHWAYYIPEVTDTPTTEPSPTFTPTTEWTFTPTATTQVDNTPTTTPTEDPGVTPTATLEITPTLPTEITPTLTTEVTPTQGVDPTPTPDGVSACKYIAAQLEKDPNAINNEFIQKLLNDPETAKQIRRNCPQGAGQSTGLIAAIVALVVLALFFLARRLRAS